MLSIDYIREHKQEVVEAAKNKNRIVDIDQLLAADDKRKNTIHNIQSLREERNTISKNNPDDTTKQRARHIKEELKILENNLRETENDIEKLLLQIPNVPLQEVPIGKDEKANVEVRTWGKLPKFNFQPKSHIELGEMHDLIDLEKGSKISGFRGYFLKNQLAQLHLSVLLFAFQTLAHKKFTPIIAPAIVKGFTLVGTGQFPWGEQEVYKLNDEDAYLAGTGEVPVTSFFANEIIDEGELPKKFVIISPCFRREAGSYGKDTKGLYRVHEFWKVEQVVIAKNDLDAAKQLHEELQTNAEHLLQQLEIPYRVLLMSTGDMGEPQIFKHDIEAWLPSKNAYGEMMSNSIMGDFQMRRLKTKYRTKEGKTEYCWSLNNTAIASPRILIPLLENHQQEDGSIAIPKALQSFVGFDKISST